MFTEGFSIWCLRAMYMAHDGRIKFDRGPALGLFTVTNYTLVAIEEGLQQAAYIRSCHFARGAGGLFRAWNDYVDDVLMF
jgi:hypothetical protein